ncbi:BglG family transcription antiterminator [Clostridium fallax]|uniref:Transcriptional antiterminator, BglG family n=1 Tax=Clostridium fallax TaxID=1533 RepID=A0A1M4Z5J8_9CLOT|nr:BglG family transcription antiterminator [Clostridium fallax]SHF13228.1 transcriptional antiterminator, BglG family [Clostridium fallax]SQB05888.1 transcription antiterminator [Clostridium fallax]
MIYDFLNIRQEKILKILINSDDSITGDKLAKSVEISRKTLQKEIPAINSFIKNYKCNIISSRGVGYKFEKEDFNLYLSLEKFLNKKEALMEEKDLRIKTIISTLALISVCYGKGSIKIEELADKLYVSTSTIKNDIKEVKDILKDYDLEISRNGNSGIKIIGDERKIRSFISDYFVRKNSKDVNNEIKGLLGDYNDYFPLVASNVLETLEKFNINITDLGFNNLCTHILITLYRIKNNKIVSYDAEPINFKENEHKAAEFLKNCIENNFHIKFPKSEVIYLYQHLVAQKRLYIDKDFIQSREDRKIIDWIRMCNEDIYSYTGIDFNSDDILSKGLFTHLRSAFNRINYGMNIKNFMLEDIKKNYPFAFEIATYFAKSLNKFYEKEINENEVGFIALHFGGAIERLRVENKVKKYKTIVVCATGVGTSILVKAKLESKFSDVLEIVGFYPAFKLKSIDLSKYDFIITTIPLKTYDIPVIQVSPILLDDDCNKINRFIRSKIYNISKLSNLFKEEIFFKDLSFKNKKEAIEYMSSQMLNLGYIDENMKNSFIEREDMGTTEIGNFVAIPHGIKGEVYKEAIGVAILNEPIEWQYGKVQLIFMLCLKKGQVNKNEELFAELYRNLDSEEKVLNIIESKDLSNLCKNY